MPEPAPAVPGALGLDTVHPLHLRLAGDLAAVLHSPPGGPRRALSDGRYEFLFVWPKWRPDAGWWELRVVRQEPGEEGSAAPVVRMTVRPDARVEVTYLNPDGEVAGRHACAGDAGTARCQTLTERVEDAYARLGGQAGKIREHCLNHQERGSDA